MNKSTTTDEQIDILKKYGLDIEEEDKTRHYLNYIGFHRLSLYFYIFFETKKDNNEKQFIKGTKFTDILNIYILDRKIRLHTMDSLERIETAIKATISDYMSVKNKSNWLEKEENFSEKTFKNKKGEEQTVYSGFSEHTLKEIKKDKDEQIIKFYKKEENKNKYPSSWMIFEVLSFGSVSHIFSILKGKNQREIATIFSLNKEDLQSWLRTLSFLRNKCAHHSRIWNQKFTITPKSINKITNGNGNSFFGYIHVLNHFMKIVNPGSLWIENLKNLIEEQESGIIEKMGFPKDFDWNTFK